MNKIISIAVLSSEIFHVLGHVNVLLRVNPPEQEWFNEYGIYFVWDMLSAFISYYLTQEIMFLPTLIIHTVVHFFYIITWNRGYYANRISEWSSKEYNGKYITIDFFLTLFDIFVHLTMIYSLTNKILMS